MEYQLPRLTRMWTHLERQAGGQVKGMGEKQIEVDKRILRTQVSNFHLFIINYVCLYWLVTFGPVQIELQLDINPLYLLIFWRIEEVGL